MKIAIVGKSPHSMLAAPYTDESWEIWWTGAGADKVPRYTRAFELHDLEDGKRRWPAEYWAWLTTDHGKPLYIAKEHPEFPHATVYPKDSIVAEFGTYYSSSVSWEISLAIQLGATDIALYGVDMAMWQPGHLQESEYGYQRPSCEFHLGIARGRGINVYVHPHSSLLKCDHLYGFDLQASERARRIQQRKKFMRERHEEQRAAEIFAFGRKQFYEGVLEAYAESEQWT